MSHISTILLFSRTYIIWLPCRCSWTILVLSILLSICRPFLVDSLIYSIMIRIFINIFLTCVIECFTIKVRNMLTKSHHKQIYFLHLLTNHLSFSKTERNKLTYIKNCTGHILIRYLLLIRSPVRLKGIVSWLL